MSGTRTLLGRARGSGAIAPFPGWDARFLKAATQDERAETATDAVP
jgi:hypothetical protein